MKVFGVTGWKNTGKTGLMERLVSEFTNRGLTVSTIKHAHHAFDVDHEGKAKLEHAGRVSHLSPLRALCPHPRVGAPLQMRIWIVDTIADTCSAAPRARRHLRASSLARAAHPAPDDSASCSLPGTRAARGGSCTSSCRRRACRRLDFQ